MDDGSGGLFVLITASPGTPSVNDAIYSISRNSLESVKTPQKLIDAELVIELSGELASSRVQLGVSAAFDSMGYLYMSSAGMTKRFDLTTANETGPGISLGWATTSIATCMIPPTIQVVKQVDQVPATDLFDLLVRRPVEGSQPFVSRVATTGSTSPTTNPSPVPIIPVTDGNRSWEWNKTTGAPEFSRIESYKYAVSEEANVDSGAVLTDYSTSYQCGGAAEPAEGDDPVNGDGPTVTLGVPAPGAADLQSAGAKIHCTFTNTAESIVASLAAAPITGTKVNPGQAVTYTLTFDSLDGSSSSDFSFESYLADVLDDAGFVDGEDAPVSEPQLKFRVTEQNVPGEWGSAPKGLTSSWGGTEDPVLSIRWSIPANTKLEVQYVVKVLPNSENALGAGGAEGRLESNEGDIPPSATC